MNAPKTVDLMKEYEKILAERNDLKSRLQIEHDNYLSVHRDNMKLFDRNMDLKNCLQVAVDKFEAIVGYAGTRRQKIMRDIARDAIAKIREPK